MMHIWKYEEKKESHRLVKLYKENHGEGEPLGDMSEEDIKNLILEIKPNINLNQAYGTLVYFGLLPILVIE